LPDKTLYISDLDGTLLNRSAELSGYTIKTMNALIAGGLNFSVATARTLATAAKILSGLSLKLPIVLMNGVLTYDPERQRYLHINALSPETTARSEEHTSELQSR
jgi:HAD superfamily hydrolase (TIGR01484 family)